MSAKQPTWNRDDEREFTEMMRRRELVMGRRIEAVQKVARTIWLPNMDEADLIDRMIACADALRDALEPFDSGVRLENLSD